MQNVTSECHLNGRLYQFTIPNKYIVFKANNNFVATLSMVNKYTNLMEEEFSSNQRICWFSRVFCPRI